MSSMLVQLELALHDADCPGHGPDFEGHGDKYTNLAKAAAVVFPPDREPWWLTDRKLIQEASLNRIMDQLRGISEKMGAAPPTTYDELYHDIQQILPTATFSTDNEGQLVVYTNKQFGKDNRTLTQFKVKE